MVKSGGFLGSRDKSVQISQLPVQIIVKPVPRPKNLSLVI